VSAEAANPLKGVQLAVIYNSLLIVKCMLESSGGKFLIVFFSVRVISWRVFKLL